MSRQPIPFERDRDEVAASFARATNPGCRPTSVALALFLGALALLVLAAAAAVLLVAVQLTHLGGNLADGLSGTVQSAGQTLAQGVQGAAQSVQDATDPLHPPRYAIHEDPQFDQLQVIAAGARLGDSQQYHFDVVAIEQRPDATTADARVYARIHRHLIVPKETKILGVTVRTDDQGQDYALYRGEEFAMGGYAYKVNWLSSQTRQVAVVRFRDASEADEPLVFDEP